MAEIGTNRHGYGTLYLSVYSGNDETPLQIFQYQLSQFRIIIFFPIVLDSDYLGL